MQEAAERGSGRHARLYALRHDLGSRARLRPSQGIVTIATRAHKAGTLPMAFDRPCRSPGAATASTRSSPGRARCAVDTPEPIAAETPIKGSLTLPRHDGRGPCDPGNPSARERRRVPALGAVLLAAARRRRQLIPRPRSTEMIWPVATSAGPELSGRSGGPAPRRRPPRPRPRKRTAARRPWAASRSGTPSAALRRR
jgi:hypothetical protein